MKAALGRLYHAVYLSDFCFVDRALSAAEILAGRSPRAHGIFLRQSRQSILMRLQPSGVLLSWSGGGTVPGSKKETFALTNNALWRNVTALYEATQTPSSPAGNSDVFFRVSWASSDRPPVH